MKRPASIWLTRYLTVQRLLDADISRLLVKHAPEIVREAAALVPESPSAPIGRRVRSLQRRSTRAALHATLAALFAAVGDAVRARRQDAARVAAENGLDWDEGLLKVAFPDPDERAQFRASVAATAVRGVDAVIARRLRSRRPLAASVYGAAALASGWVDDVIDAGLLRGSGAREIAARVRANVRPDVPGGVSYAAMRLGRTELNNAYHALSIENAVTKPWVISMEWRLSGSHPKNAPPDECDRRDRRRYPPDEVPAKPHPNCLCYVIPVVPTAAEFERNLRQGHYDDYLYGGIERAG